MQKQNEITSMRFVMVYFPIAMYMFMFILSLSKGNLISGLSLSLSLSLSLHVIFPTVIRVQNYFVNVSLTYK
jgi:hypothetical protein